METEAITGTLSEKAQERTATEAACVDEGAVPSVTNAGSKAYRQLSEGSRGRAESASECNVDRLTRKLMGHIDSASSVKIVGWVWDPKQPADRIALELAEGESVIASTVANISRPGLVKSGIGDGKHEFSISFPEGLFTKDVHILDLRCADTKAPVPGSPITIVPRQHRSTAAVEEDDAPAGAFGPVDPLERQAEEALSAVWPEKKESIDQEISVSNDVASLKREAIDPTGTETLGDIEIFSKAADNSTWLLSGWLRASLAESTAIDLRINLDDNDTILKKSILFHDKEGPAHDSRSFVALVDVGSLRNGVLARIISCEFLSSSSTALWAQKGPFLELSRRRHLEAVVPYLRSDSDPDAEKMKQWLAVSIKSEAPPKTNETVQADTQGKTLRDGRFEKLGPDQLTGWVQLETANERPSFALLIGESTRPLAVALKDRDDLSESVLGFPAKGFLGEMPFDIPYEDFDSIEVLCDGRRVKRAHSFKYESPLYFRVASIYGAAVEAIGFDIRHPQRPVDFEIVLQDGTIFPAKERYWAVATWRRGSTVTGMIGLSANLMNAVRGRRVRAECRVSGTKFTAAEFILDGSVDGMRALRKEKGTPRAGKVDQIGPHFIGGWVSIVDGIEPSVECRLNGNVYTVVKARRPRPDVEVATGVDARGFYIPLPARNLLAGPNTLEVVRLDNGKVLDAIRTTIDGPTAAGKAWATKHKIIGEIRANLLTATSRLELIIGKQVIGSVNLHGASNASQELLPFEMVLPDRSLERGQCNIRLMPQGILLEWGQEVARLEGTLRSNFEGLHDGALTGWLYDAKNDEKLLGVLFRLDGRLFAEVTASDLRPDLKVTGINTYNHGFRIPIPKRLQDGLLHEVAVINVESMEHLRGSPQMIQFPRGIHDLPFPRTPHLNNLRLPVGLFRQSKVRTSEHPDFSLIILNKDAGEVLERAFESIEDFLHCHTIEILVVDHDSGDNSLAVVDRWAGRLPIKLIARSGNNTFSYSNNFAAKHARGKRLAFVNNDIVFTEDVLVPIGNFMDNNPDVGLVGIKLLELRKSKFSDEKNEFNVHHLGIAYIEDRSSRVIRPMEIVDDSDNAWRTFIPTEVASVTGAFCVMNSDEFASIDGFDEDFFYGYEDVTLGLKVRTTLGKRVVCLNNVTSFHHRGFVRLSGKMDDVFMRRVRHNDKIINDLYGKVIRDCYIKSLFSRDWVYTGARLRLAFIVYDASPVTRAGDYFTAKEIASELVKLYDCEVVFIDASMSWARAGECDVVINMRNEFDIRDLANPKASCLKIAWLRNNFEDWLDSGSLESYDFVLTSSGTFIEEVYNKTGIRSRKLEIAANPDTMARGVADPQYRCDVLFNGSFSGASRDLGIELANRNLPFEFKVFGAGWEGSSLEHYWHGYAPYESMPDLYKSTKIVIDDANTSARAWGGTNSRVFDALSAGRLVITNSKTTSYESFDGLLPVWSHGDDLISSIDYYLKNSDERYALVERLRDITLHRHSYASRANTLVEVIQSGSSCRRISVRVCAPSRNTTEVWGDVHFADLLAFELRRMGYVVAVHTRDEWHLAETRSDVVIDLRGLTYFPKCQTAINIAWVISHPNDISASEIAQYDHLFGASQKSCDRFRAMGAKSVSLLPQCASVKCAPVDQEFKLRSSILYAGNTRGERRVGVSYLQTLNEQFDLIGYGWENFAPIDHVLAERVPYQQLLSLYGEAKITINDHWADMREWGIVSNRVFDVAAAGGCVVSDAVEGLEDLFDGCVPTYTDRASFEKVVQALLGDDIWRQQIAEKAQKIVLKRHLFGHRAAVFHEFIQMLSSSLYGLATPNNAC